MSDYDESDVLDNEIGMLALRIDTLTYLRLKAAAEAVTKQLATAQREVERLREELSGAVSAAEDFNAQRVEVGRAYRRVLDERDAANRELERWRHGNTIEGDFVCPNELRAVTAERERDAMREALVTARYPLAVAASYVDDKTITLGLKLHAESCVAAVRAIDGTLLSTTHNGGGDGG